MCYEQFMILIHTIINEGITVSMWKDVKNEVVYDVHTEAKSHLYLKFTNQQCAYYGRYDSGFINTFNDLLFEVKNCLCGRDYINPSWVAVLKKYEMWEEVK